MAKIKVLVVNDEENFLRMVRLNLEAVGEYEVFTLLGAEDIVHQVQILKPDIILLDILMPRLGGLQACEILQGDSFCKEIPIVVISALDSDVDKEKARKFGVADYLTKPVETATIVSTIKRVLKTRRENG